MTSPIRPPLFEGVQQSGTTIAVPIPIVAGALGFQVSWPDAVTAATFVLELTSWGPDAELGDGGTGVQLAGGGMAVDAGSAPETWADSGQAIAAVVAGAAGSFHVFASGLRARRARLLIEASALSFWRIWNGVTDV